jgi:hypothetical protein
MAQDRTPAVAGTRRLLQLLKDPLEAGSVEAIFHDLMSVLAAVGDDERMNHRQTAITIAAIPEVPHLTAGIRSVVEKTKVGEEGELVVNKIVHPIKKRRVPAMIPNADVSTLLHPQPRRQLKLLP